MMVDKPNSALEVVVESPCVSVCTLDVDDICTGCFRTRREISQWRDYSNEQREKVLLRIQQDVDKNYS